MIFQTRIQNCRISTAGIRQTGGAQCSDLKRNVAADPAYRFKSGPTSINSDQICADGQVWAAHQIGGSSFRKAPDLWGSLCSARHPRETSSRRLQNESKTPRLDGPVPVKIPSCDGGALGDADDARNTRFKRCRAAYFSEARWNACRGSLPVGWQSSSLGCGPAKCRDRIRPTLAATWPLSAKTGPILANARTMSTNIGLSLPDFGQVCPTPSDCCTTPAKLGPISESIGRRRPNSGRLEPSFAESAQRCPKVNNRPSGTRNDPIWAGFDRFWPSFGKARS